MRHTGGCMHYFGGPPIRRQPNLMRVQSRDPGRSVQHILLDSFDLHCCVCFHKEDWNRSGIPWRRQFPRQPWGDEDLSFLPVGVFLLAVSGKYVSLSLQLFKLDYLICLFRRKFDHLMFMVWAGFILEYFTDACLRCTFLNTYLLNYYVCWKMYVQIWNFVFRNVQCTNYGEHACMHHLSNCNLLAAKDSFAEKEIHPYMGCSWVLFSFFYTEHTHRWSSVSKVKKF